MTEKTGKQKSVPARPESGAARPESGAAQPESGAARPESGAARPESPKTPDEARATEAVQQRSPSDEWALYEVFVRARRGLSHNHVGSVHAPDARSALQNARDLYTRRQEGTSLWVVPSVQISANSPEEKDSYFDPAADKVYRFPTFYDVPAGVKM